MNDIPSAPKEPVKIVIVDSGIDPEVNNLNKYIVKSTGFRINKEGYITEANCMETRHLHGTAIALIIRHLCTHVQFISINVLNERLATDGRLLLHAVEKAILYGPDIIHLSLGTTKWKYIFPFKNLVKEASLNNILIVSAASNQGKRSYPACLKGVVGVKADRSFSFRTFRYDNKHFYGPLKANDITGIDEIRKKTCIAGTSMSAAFVTGYFAAEMYSKKIYQPKRIIEHMKAISFNN